jgi:L-lactate dehydrogenase complex protein LldG
MNARDMILTAVSRNKPVRIELPKFELHRAAQYEKVVEKFMQTLDSIGGKTSEIDSLELVKKEIESTRSAGHLVVDVVNEATPTMSGQPATELEKVHFVYMKADIGVAENGAVWIRESQMGNRLLPFICQHLVVILEKKDIVSNMHEAYKKVDCFEEGFGAFIAGPSKTADIEQSLVIGAHGARSLKVYLIA